DVVGLEETPVAAAAIHQRGREFAAELGLRLRDDARQPFDAADGVGLGGQLGLIEHDGGGATALDAEEIIAADGLDQEGVVVAGFATADLILGIVIQMLGGDPVGREKVRFATLEIAGGIALALRVLLDRVVEESTELGGEVVVFHATVTLTRNLARATRLRPPAGSRSAA